MSLNVQLVPLTSQTVVLAYESKKHSISRMMGYNSHCRTIERLSFTWAFFILCTKKLNRNFNASLLGAFMDF